MHDTILILDFGSQLTQLIARRVREAQVYCEVHPCDVDNAWVAQYATSYRIKGVILSGSHASVYDSEDVAPTAIYELGVPVLGICYGMQTMAAQLGGMVQASHSREFGRAQLDIVTPCTLLADFVDADDGNTTSSADGADSARTVWMSHGDKVVYLPPGFAAVATTSSCPMAVMADETRHFYGVQFHPEVTHTVQGSAMLRRFVLDICDAQADWQMGNYLEEAIAAIRQQVGDEEVILGLSGGVDSSVAAALIHRAIGEQLTCVFVDHGLLRLNERQLVEAMFTDRLHAQVRYIDAAEQFMQALQGVSDPEEKRKIIGREFVEVFKAEAEKLKAGDSHHQGASFLAQGTIYPDVIESGGAKSKKAVTIKSHHNVGGLPADLGLKLLEPLRDLFKDEVRQLGLELGLPAEMVFRHPFPGPGLGVRILGAIQTEYADLLRHADHIFIEELRNTIDPDSGKNWYDLTSQAFAVFLPVKSVGVMGDGRTYEYVVALRAVVTSDFMTADWAELPHSLLKTVSSRIINEIRGINRVTYDVSSKPPATIEWE